jgi:hypothetical protein
LKWSAPPSYIGRRAATPPYKPPPTDIAIPLTHPIHRS